MQILIFNQSEGKRAIILQTSWGLREALGWGEEEGQSDKQEEGGRRTKMEGGQNRGCRGLEGMGTPGPMDRLPEPACLPHCTDKEERGSNLPVTPEGGRERD